MLKSDFWFGFVLASITLTSLLLASPVTNVIFGGHWFFEMLSSIAFGVPLIISICGLSALNQYCYDWPNGKSVRKAILFSLVHGGIAGVVVIVFFGYLVLFTPYDIRNLRALVMFLVLFLFYLSLGTAYAWYKCRAGRF
jgi:hypothetical protein